MIKLKKQLGFALSLIILMVIVLIAAVGVGYYFYKTSQEKKEIFCTTNSDCETDFCNQERHVCFEVRYVCENEKCSSISKEHANYSCAKDYYGSINFTGGTILEVEYKEVRPEIRVIAEKFADLFGSISIQPTGEKGIILQMKHIDEVTHQQVLQRLGEIEEKYFESVRGTIDYSKCLGTCGDNICRFPETKDWCPEDCLKQSKEISPKIKSADLVTVKPIIEDKLSKWIDEWQEIMPEFNISIFRNVSEKTITSDVEYTYDSEKQNKLREILYVYSPNGKKFIDPYVYLDLYEDNGRLRPAFDIDSAVTLVDLENKKWKRLLSCGTPCSFNDVVWVDNNTFVIVGNTEYYPSSGEERCTVSTKCTYVATLHIFDLSKNKVILYYGPESERRPILDLRDKFPNIDFD